MSKRLYLGHIPGSAQRADIEDFFKPFGRINDIRLMAGFGFIEFDDARDAEDAVRDCNGKDFMGDRLLVEFAKSPRSFDGPPRGPGGDRGDRGPMRFGPRGSGHRIVVRGLPDGTSWQDLKDFARSAGQVSYADVDRMNPSEGTIEYPNKDDFDAAIKTLDGGQINGATVSVGDASAAGVGGYAAPPPRRDDYDRGGDRGGYSRRDDYDDRRSSYRRDDRDRGSYDRRDDRGVDRDRGSYSRSARRSRSPPPRSASGRDRSRSPPPRERSPVPPPRASRDDRDRY